jgi:hypothetical protein
LGLRQDVQDLVEVRTMRCATLLHFGHLGPGVSGWRGIVGVWLEGESAGELDRAEKEQVAMEEMHGGCEALVFLGLVRPIGDVLFGGVGSFNGVQTGGPPLNGIFELGPELWCLRL